MAISHDHNCRITWVYNKYLFFSLFPGERQAPAASKSVVESLPLLENTAKGYKINSNFT